MVGGHTSIDAQADVQAHSWQAQDKSGDAVHHPIVDPKTSAQAKLFIQ